MKVKGMRNLLGCISLGLAIAVSGCGGGNSPTGADTTTAPASTTGGTTQATVASLSLTPSPTTLPTDNTASATVTVSALDAGNAAVSGAVVLLSADSGILNVPSVTTTNGNATFTFSAGTTSKSNRTATITAKVGAVTSILPIQITGSTVTAQALSTALVVNQSTTLTVTAMDSAGSRVPGAPVSIAATAGPGSVTLGAASITTGADGTASVTVTGVTGGTSILTITALGATTTSDFTISSPVAAFGITEVVNGAETTVDPVAVGMTFDDALTVKVAAPTTGAQRTLRFVTSQGTWGNNLNSQLVTAVGGFASAVLTTNQAGVATVQVVDVNLPTNSDTLTVGMTSATPVKVRLQGSPTVVQKSVGTTAGTSELIATVLDASDNPVGNQPVVFSLSDTTGGGEALSLVLGVSASTPGDGLSLGQVRTTFTAGSLPSAQSGVKIHASIPGTVVQTGVAPSSNNLAIVIGGTAGSIAFGQATVAEETANATAYKHARSVLVSDSNGNPVNGAVVTLSLWPVEYNTGEDCVVADNFPNEDINENLSLDAGEDFNGDGVLWPINSAAGSVPAIVTTDASGVATFDHVYTKSNAIWTRARLRAKALVQGSETLSQVEFSLVPLEKDINPCRLPDSPYGLTVTP